jgi:hypothetical protein
MRWLAALIFGIGVFCGPQPPSAQALPVTELAPETKKVEPARPAPQQEPEDHNHSPAPDGGDNVTNKDAGEKPLPEILTDPAQLPEPVRLMRQRILDAALSGDPEKLRIAIEVNEVPPAFSFSEKGDAIAAMKKESNDGEGREIMAILAEVMEAGFVHVDKGTPQEMYVWPYFAQYPLDKLTPAQIIELFRIVTAYEFTEMKQIDAYNFYRVGISPDGVWHFFVTGD